MRLLLDTHVLLWFISGDAQLPTEWRDSIRDVENEVYLSVVSLWEAIIKHALGKLPLPLPAAQYLPVQRAGHRIASLPLDEASICRLATLPATHRDPFDRMQVCQAIEHGLTIVTGDPVFKSYPAPTLGAA